MAATDPASQTPNSWLCKASRCGASSITNSGKRAVSAERLSHTVNWCESRWKDTIQMISKQKHERGESCWFYRGGTLKRNELDLWRRHKKTKLVTFTTWHPETVSMRRALSVWGTRHQRPPLGAASVAVQVCFDMKMQHYGKYCRKLLTLRCLMPQLCLSVGNLCRIILINPHPSINKPNQMLPGLTRQPESRNERVCTCMCVCPYKPSKKTTTDCQFSV